MKTAILLGLMFCASPIQAYANDFEDARNEFSKMLDEVEADKKRRMIKLYEGRVETLICISEDFETDENLRMAANRMIMFYRTKIQELTLDCKCVK